MKSHSTYIRQTVLLLILAACWLSSSALVQAQTIIASVFPTNAAINVGLSGPVVFTFSAPMNTAATTVMFMNSSVPPPNFLTMTMAWNADGTRLTNTPAQPFPAHSTIAWLVVGQDALGLPLGGNFNGAFMTGGGGAGTTPTLIATVPPDNATNVPGSNSVVLSFSTAMDTNLTTIRFYEISAPLDSLPVSLSWSAPPSNLTCIPNPDFPAGKVIVWYAQGQDLAGNAFPGGSGNFSTAGGGTNEPARPPIAGLLSRGDRSEQVDTNLFRVTGHEFLALAGTAPSTAAAVAAPAPRATNVLATAGLPEFTECSRREAQADSFATNYPAGSYQFLHNTTGVVSRASIHLADSLAPPAPRLANWQSPPRVVLGEPLPLQWVFEGGGAPVDYVRLRISKSGRVVYATPLPGADGALNGLSNNVVVPADVFTNIGRAEVSLACFSFTALDTNSIPGIVLRAARHRTTTFKLRVVDGATPPPILRTTNLFGVPVGEAVMYPLRTTNGVQPIRFTQVGGALPPGLTLNPDGSFVGQAAGAGAYDATLRLTDLLGQNTTQTLHVVTAPLMPSGAAPRMQHAALKNAHTLRFDVLEGEGADRVIERSTNLVNWAALFTTNSPLNRLTLEAPVDRDKLYFRVRGVGAPLPAPRPLRVTPVLNTNLTATAELDFPGGTLSLTNTAGYVITLQVPRDALERRTVITMTEVTQIGGLPSSGGLSAAVSLQPEGLVFRTPAHLSITGPAAPAPGTVLSFTALSDGRLFALHPSFITNRTVSLHLSYLFLAGTGLGTPADAQTQRLNVPDDPLMALGQDLEIIRMTNALGGGAKSLRKAAGIVTAGPYNPDDPLDKALMDRLLQTGNQVVVPALKNAAQSADDATLDNALNQWHDWVEQVQVVQFADDIGGEDAADAQLKACMQTASGLASKGIWNGMTKACEQCLSHDIQRIGRVHSLAKAGASLGWTGYQEYYEDCVRKCMAFEVKILSKITATGSRGTYVTDTKTTIELEMAAEYANLSYTGQGEWQVLNVEDFGTECPVTHSPQNGTAQLLLVRITITQPRCNYVAGTGLVVAEEYAPEMRAYLSAEEEQMPKETRAVKCPEFTRDEPDVFGPAFVALHNRELTPPVVAALLGIEGQVIEMVPIERGSGDLIVKKWYVQSQPLHEGTVQEDTTIELHHTPQP